MPSNFDSLDIRPEKEKQYSAFITQKKKWIERLGGSDPIQIKGQIYNIMTRASFWASLNVARKELAGSEKDFAIKNSSLLRLIDEGFFSGQLLSVRRLIDRSKGANSLHNLIESIKSNSHLFTREIFVCHQGYPFDVSIAEDRENRIIADYVARGESAFSLPTDPMCNPLFARRAHQCFDKIQGGPGEEWRRDDRADPKYFDSLLHRLRLCRSLVDYVDRRIAHSDWREKSEPVRTPVIIRLIVAVRIICQVANEVSWTVLQENASSFFPIRQYNPFDFLDCPFTSGETIGLMEEHLTEFGKYVDGWVGIKH